MAGVASGVLRLSGFPAEAPLIGGMSFCGFGKPEITLCKPPIPHPEIALDLGHLCLPKALLAFVSIMCGYHYKVLHCRSRRYGGMSPRLSLAA